MQETLNRPPASELHPLLDDGFTNLSHTLETSQDSGVLP